MTEPYLDEVNTSFYVQLEPVRSIGGRVIGTKAVRLTQQNPTTPLGGTVVVKLRVRLPAHAFEPLEPPMVTIPASQVTVLSHAEAD